LVARQDPEPGAAVEPGTPAILSLVTRTR
jgi:hypothetical protein